jgi:hypothetical protein
MAEGFGFSRFNLQHHRAAGNRPGLLDLVNNGAVVHEIGDRVYFRSAMVISCMRLEENRGHITRGWCGLASTAW